jgi:hypothetical protein
MAKKRTSRKNPAAVALAHRRAAKLTPEQRQAIARKGGLARAKQRKRESGAS